MIQMLLDILTQGRLVLPLILNILQPADQVLLNMVITLEILGMVVRENNQEIPMTGHQIIVLEDVENFLD